MLEKKPLKNSHISHYWLIYQKKKKKLVLRICFKHKKKRIEVDPKLCTIFDGESHIVKSNLSSESRKAQFKMVAD